MVINRGRRDRGHGFALIGSLWAVLILAVIAASILTTSSTESRLARNRLETAELNALADAVINIVILRLLSTDSSLHPPVDSTPFAVTFAGRNARVTIQDEAGKIDLNQAPDELLLRLLSAHGLDLDTARPLVDKILDWREPGADRRLHGAKADEYRIAGIPYGPRNGPFESIEELKLVMGMTARLFEDIAPSLTVYAQSSWPNPDLSPRDVLGVLPGMDDERIGRLMEARAARSRNGIRTGSNVSVLGDAVSIVVILPGRDAMRVVRSAVVRLTGFLTAPIWIYRWN